MEEDGLHAEEHPPDVENAPKTARKHGTNTPPIIATWDGIAANADGVASMHGARGAKKVRGSRKEIVDG